MCDDERTEPLIGHCEAFCERDRWFSLKELNLKIARNPRGSYLKLSDQAPVLFLTSRMIGDTLRNVTPT